MAARRLHALRSKPPSPEIGDGSGGEQDWRKHLRADLSSPWSGRNAQARYALFRIGCNLA
eukprot:2768495-Rhodomonas_salina.1